MLDIKRVLNAPKGSVLDPDAVELSLGIVEDRRPIPAHFPEPTWRSPTDFTVWKSVWLGTCPGPARFAVDLDAKNCTFDATGGQMLSSVPVNRKRQRVGLVAVLDRTLAHIYKHLTEGTPDGYSYDRMLEAALTRGLLPIRPETAFALRCQHVDQKQGEGWLMAMQPQNPFDFIQPQVLRLDRNSRGIHVGTFDVMRTQYVNDGGLVWIFELPESPPT